MIKKATQSSSGSTDLTAVATDVLPSTDNTYDLGSSSKRFAEVYGTTVYSGAFTAPSTSGFVFTSNVTDSAAAVAFSVDAPTVNTAGGLLFRVREGSTTIFRIDHNGNATPGANNTYTLGSGSAGWSAVYTNQVVVGANITDAGGNIRYTTGSSAGNTITGRVADGASAVAHTFTNGSSLTNASSKIAEFHSGNGSTLKLSIGFSGKLTFDATDSSGSPGAATIDKPSGQVSVANGVSSVVVTNALVSTTSVVMAVLQDNTDAIYVRSVVPGAGSFTINMSGNTSAARKVGFTVFN